MEFGAARWDATGFGMAGMTMKPMQHPLLSAFQYTARCLWRWEERDYPMYLREELARTLVEDADPDGWIAMAMLTAWR